MPLGQIYYHRVEIEGEVTRTEEEVEMDLVLIKPQQIFRKKSIPIIANVIGELSFCFVCFVLSTNN